MTDTIEVETSLGIFELKRPKAGVRNRAIIKAESDSGVIKQAVLMTELIPKCINRRPEAIDQDTRIDHVLDSMGCDDYDLLFVALEGLMNTSSITNEKKTKLDLSSTTEPSQNQ